jgi:hypothetical protein
MEELVNSFISNLKKSTSEPIPLKQIYKLFNVKTSNHNDLNKLRDLFNKHNLSLMLDSSKTKISILNTGYEPDELVYIKHSSGRKKAKSNNKLRGLIILPGPANEILDGYKTIEYRNWPCNFTGTIGIIISKTKKVWGFVDIVDCQNYSGNYQFMLENVQKLKEPIPYKHKQGCVTWVDLEHIRDKIPETIKIV